MRAKTLSAVALSVAAMLLCRVTPAQDAASAKAFLEDVYRHYQYGYRGDTSGIDLDGPNANKYFDSSLLALEKADVKANAGSVPAIDWDPICGCQDWDGIWNLRIEIEIVTAQKARTNVSFSLRDPKYRAAQETRQLQITLVKERSAWRIYDIFDRSDHTFSSSVRKMLQDDLVSLRKIPAPGKSP